jgi:hypothetical protein
MQIHHHHKGGLAPLRLKAEMEVYCDSSSTGQGGGTSADRVARRGTAAVELS